MNTLNVTRGWLNKAEHERKQENGNSPSREGRLELQVLRDPGAMEQIAPAWMSLMAGGDGTPFSSPCWLTPWARRFAQEVYCVSGWYEGALAGIVPLHVWRDESSGIRKLLLLGTGISDYLDAVCHPEWTETFMDQFQEWLRANEHLWDECNFQQVTATSALRKLKGAVERDGENCLVVALHRTLADTLPARQFEKLRYYRRRAARTGGFQVRQAEGKDCGRGMELLFRLHEARWRERGQSGLLNDELVQEFHREAAEKLANAGMLRLYLAELNGKEIGALYAFASGKRTFYYLGGFDPAYATLSPGMLLIGHAMEKAIEEGQSHFDFLRGEEPYKNDWGAVKARTGVISLRHREEQRID